MAKIYKIIKRNFNDVSMNRMSMIRCYSELRGKEIKKILRCKNIKVDLCINWRTLNGESYMLTI